MDEAEAQERIKRFVNLLNHLLDRCQGVKGKLAQQLDIKPSTLTPWLQGKRDPASLEPLVFDRIAEVSGHSTDSLALLFKIIEVKKQANISQEQFKNLIEQMLLTQSREQLGMRLGVSPKTISNWLNRERDVDPGKIPIFTLAKIAIERGWTIARLLAHLNLKKTETIEQDILDLIESKSKQLSFSSRLKLLSWLCSNFEQELSHLNLAIVKTKEDFLNSENFTIITPQTNLVFTPGTVLIVLEQKDLVLASVYSSNLVLQVQIQPENIKIGTIDRIPETLVDTDLLIFDISTANSASISFIEDLEFNGEIIIFAEAAALTAIRERLEDRVSSIFLKPFDWSTLKSQPFFQRGN